MKPFYHPKRQDISLSAVLDALSDPTRLLIVRRLLTESELSCKEFGITTPKSTLSHHFKTLRVAGLTCTRAEGTQHFVSLRREDLEARFPGLLAMIAEASDPL